ncbi:hypothetical protein ABH992_003286 [Bradyrhizobium yuanmingense]|uniref:Mannitol dehydrogenase N-terminal domain-containing protein n=1 Tax=Bradyrhizobium yuanmingense TaxID=108015 RepID=A0ABV4GIQ1_9BRAD
MRHVHFGAGKLGLGFAGSVAMEFGLDFIVANRGDAGSSALSERNQLLAQNSEYTIKYYTGQPDVVSVNRFLNWNHDPDRAALQQLISDVDTVLITTSLDGNHKEIADIVQAGLLMRSANQGTPALVLAFENGISDQDLRNAFMADASSEYLQTIDSCSRYIPCVVDRVCNNVRLEESNVLVDAERYGCLSLPVNAKSLIEAVGIYPGPLVKFERDLEIARMKKIWLFNGPHLMLAINAHYERAFDFQEYVCANKGLTTELLQEFALGCFQACLTRGALSPQQVNELDSDLQATAQSTQKRFEQTPGLVSRIMKRFRQPTKEKPSWMEEFFSNMKYKVIEPAHAYRDRTGHMPRRISETLLRAVDLISDRRFIEGTD